MDILTSMTHNRAYLHHSHGGQHPEGRKQPQVLPQPGLRKADQRSQGQHQGPRLDRGVRPGPSAVEPHCRTTGQDVPTVLATGTFGTVSIKDGQRRSGTEEEVHAPQYPRYLERGDSGDAKGDQNQPQAGDTMKLYGHGYMRYEES